MRHQHLKNRLRQKPAHAGLIKRNLVTSLLLYETVRTTKRRAEVVQPIVEKLIGHAKKNDPMRAIRYVNQYVTDKNASRKIMEVFVKRFATRNGGLTRIVPVGARKGDGAKLVDLSFVEEMGNSKSEARNSKQIRNAKILNQQTSKPATSKLS